MRHLKLLVNNSLIFLIIAYFDLAIEASIPQIAIRPEHYNITLQQGSVDNILFYGRSHIFIRVYQPTLNIKLHAQQPQVTVLTFDLRKIDSLKEQKWKTYVNDKKNHIINYHFIEELLPGHYLLLVEFHTIIDNAGESLFKTSYTNAENET